MAKPYTRKSITQDRKIPSLDTIPPQHKTHRKSSQINKSKTKKQSNQNLFPSITMSIRYHNPFLLARHNLSDQWSQRNSGIDLPYRTLTIEEFQDEYVPNDHTWRLRDEKKRTVDLISPDGKVTISYYLGSIIHSGPPVYNGNRKPPKRAKTAQDEPQALIVPNASDDESWNVMSESEDSSDEESSDDEVEVVEEKEDEELGLLPTEEHPTEQVVVEQHSATATQPHDDEVSTVTETADKHDHATDKEMNSVAETPTTTVAETPSTTATTNDVAIETPTQGVIETPNEQVQPADGNATTTEQPQPDVNGVTETPNNSNDIAAAVPENATNIQDEIQAEGTNVDKTPVDVTDTSAIEENNNQSTMAEENQTDVADTSTTGENNNDDISELTESTGKSKYQKDQCIVGQEKLC